MRVQPVLKGSCRLCVAPQTPVRYLKTLLLPINLLVVAVIAGRVSPLIYTELFGAAQT